MDTGPAKTKFVNWRAAGDDLRAFLIISITENNPVLMKCWGSDTHALTWRD